MDALPTTFTAAEIAEALRVSENYVETRCRSGQWPHLRVARGAIRLTADDYAAVLELLRQPATAAPAATSLATPLSLRRRQRKARAAS